jgi:hypothetical protein
VHCDRLAKLLDDSTHQLAVAQSAVAASHVSRSAPPVVWSSNCRERSPLSPHRPQFTLSSPDSAIPVPARAASSYASPEFCCRSLGCSLQTSCQGPSEPQVPGEVFSRGLRYWKAGCRQSRCAGHQKDSPRLFRTNGQW